MYRLTRTPGYDLSHLRDLAFGRALWTVVVRRSYSGLRKGFAAVAREQRRVDNLNAMVARNAVVQEKHAARQALADHAAIREAEAADRTEDICEAEDQLNSILDQADAGTAPFDFGALNVKPECPYFDPAGYDVKPAAPQLSSYLPPSPSFLTRLFPEKMRRHEELAQEAQRLFDKATAIHDTSELERQTQLGQRRILHRLACKAAEDEATAKNAEVVAFQSAYEASEREAVIDYFKLVFENDRLPDNMPSMVRVTYDADSKQLVIERQLPTIDVVPSETAFRYVKKGDTIVPVVRKAADRKAMYADVLAQIALRTVHVALKADTACAVNVFAFNGFVNTIDPQTGTRVRPTLISFTTSRDSLNAIDFDLVEPVACLRGLKALVSRNAPELEAIRPLVQFDMVDRRFIDKTDVLSDLESRPNLAELSPNEFEALMTNLFGKDGPRNETHASVPRRWCRLRRMGHAARRRRESCHSSKAVS